MQQVGLFKLVSRVLTRRGASTFPFPAGADSLSRCTDLLTRLIIGLLPDSLFVNCLPPHSNGTDNLSVPTPLALETQPCVSFSGFASLDFCTKRLPGGMVWKQIRLCKSKPFSGACKGINTARIRFLSLSAAAAVRKAVGI